MKLRDLFKRRKRESFIFRGTGSPITPAMRLSAVYGCVRVLSESMASLPVGAYLRDDCGHNNPDPDRVLARVLSSEPNEVCTMYTMMELLVQSMLLQGNGYAYIERDERGGVRNLHFIPAADVTVIYPQYIDEGPSYRVNGLRDIVPASDMVHILNVTDDGIEGKSTLSAAGESTQLAGYASAAARDFYESGGSLTGVLTTDKGLTREQQEEERKKWQDLHGPKGKGGVAVLSRGLQYQPISVPPRDAQLLESRKYSLEEICRFFRVSPQKIFDFTHSSYSTVEATEIAFLNDTLRPLIVKFEQEFTRKLLPVEKRRAGGCIRFDTNQLMRADKATQAAYYSTMFQIGALSSNDIRFDIGLPHIEGGDRYFVQVNMQDLTKEMPPKESNPV